MKNSKLHVWPCLLWILLGSLLISLAVAIFLPDHCSPKKARIVFTRLCEKRIAYFLKQFADKTGELVDLNNRSIVQLAFGTNSLAPTRTNSQGKIIDYWETPFQINIIAPTNFIIRSAGPNQKFGDTDDIIFNSVSNGFVKP